MEEINVDQIMTMTAQTTAGTIIAVIVEGFNVAYVYGTGTIIVVIAPNIDGRAHDAVEHYATYHTVKTHSNVSPQYKEFTLKLTRSKVANLIKRKTPPSGGVELEVWNAFRTRFEDA